MYGFGLVYVNWPGWAQIKNLNHLDIIHDLMSFFFLTSAFVSTSLFFVVYSYALIKKEKWAHDLGEANIYILMGCVVGIFFSTLEFLIMLAKVFA